MQIKIKPIIRKEEQVDKLVDAYMKDGEAFVTIIRAFPNLREAQTYDHRTRPINPEDEESEMTEYFDEETTITEDDVDAFIAEKTAQTVASEAQEAIDQAQQKVIDRLAETMDKLLGFIAKAHTLTVTQKKFVDAFRDDYAAWINLRDA